MHNQSSDSQEVMSKSFNYWPPKYQNMPSIQQKSFNNSSLSAAGGYQDYTSKPYTSQNNSFLRNRVQHHDFNLDFLYKKSNVISNQYQIISKRAQE
mmetsp:Transcript_31684/g.30973  ORF Transcript_31684/g.30973 Transcript_31684/m.30973 type:complete len:96 (-) Transcript_31684:37-324(-)